MTPPPDPADLPGPWPDVLAAYVDGELDDVARAAVERWLSANPTARGCVDAQRRMSPENWRLWRDAAPPCPASWDAVRDVIAVRLAATRLAEPSHPRGPWELRLARVIAVPAYALTACVVLFAGFGFHLFPRHPQQVTERVARPHDDPLAGIPVLLIAADTEVDVHRVDGAGAGGWLPVGGMHLDKPLALATADDLELEEAEDHPAWPMGGPRVVRDPADAPLLFPGANRYPDPESSMLAVAGLVVAVCAPRECQPAPEQPVRITVVTVLATGANRTVDERLAELAKEVEKRDKGLTGFKLHASEAKSVAPGETARFDLIDGKNLEVKVERPRDENGRVALKIRPPGLGEVTYTCTCDRFFPVVTTHRTREGETLIVAVMARPCMLKK